MKTIDQLTGNEFKQLLDEYFAPPEKRSKMTEEEIKDLAKRLNKKINVPLISDTGEEKILIKIVLKIDHFLYDNLPNEFYDLIRSIENGIDDTEAKRLIKRLSKLANTHINIPYISERMEYIAIRFIIGIIINSARNKWDLASAKNNLANISIPGDLDSPETEIEALII